MSKSDPSALSIKPQQTTTTITTTVPHTVNPMPPPLACCKLDTYWLYPSDSSQLGPIPLAIAYVTDPNGNDYWGGMDMIEGSSSTSGVSISFGITVAYGALSLQIVGTSITLKSGGICVYKTVFLGDQVSYSPPSSYPNFAEIYTCGQIAIANYTECVYYYACGLANESEYNFTAFFVTALQVVENNSAYVSALHTNNALPQNIISYFTGTLKYLNCAPPHLGAIVPKGTIYVSTSQGAAGGAILLEPFLEYVFDVPDWIFDVVSPYVAIVPFTKSASYYAVTLVLKSESNYAYSIYYEETNITYNKYWRK